MKLKLNIAIDDVNPLKGWRILGDRTEKWLRQLNEDYGVKYTLFIPSNYHNQAPISQHKDWIQELNSISWVELAAHGHFHMTSDPQRFGECEWFELGRHEADYRFRDMSDEWHDSLGRLPSGWRSPGWLINPHNQDLIEDSFDYVAVHYEHNQGLNWKCKKFFGHDGIQQQTVAIHNEDMIMFQSHIAGKHNHNVWNEQNYDQLRLSLDYLFESYNIEPKLLKECV